MDITRRMEKDRKGTDLTKDMMLALELVLLQYPQLLSIESRIWKKKLLDWCKEYDLHTAPLERKEYLDELKRYVKNKVEEQCSTYL